MKKNTTAMTLAAGVLLAGGALGVYSRYSRVSAAPRISQLSVTKGDIVEAVVATGTLQPTRTVPVGTQVSGTVAKLYADFNSIVHPGEVIARIDPAVIQAQLDSAKASVDRATIDLNEEQETLAVDEHDLERTDQMFTRSLATEQEREAAHLVVSEDQAVVKEDQAAITVAQAAVTQAEVNLEHCVIVSPIEGLVLSRSVDEGQTVAASVSAPTLYVLATDLTTLELIGDVDESDVGRIRPGQNVTFTVDAYPTRTFPATVKVVRLNPTNVSNVVTYQVVIGVANPDRRLMPGMTASLRVETSRAADVLRVPTVALRYRPSAEIFAALGQTPPPAAPAQAPAASPRTAASAPMTEAKTIDVFFAPVPRPNTMGQVWTLDGNTLTRVPVRLGVTDGTWTELVSGDLQAGQGLVTNIVPGSVKPPK